MGDRRIPGCFLAQSRPTCVTKAGRGCYWLPLMVKCRRDSNMTLAAFTCALIMTCVAVPAADLELITKEEAARPDDPYRISVSKDRGPYPPPTIVPRMGE